MSDQNRRRQTRTRQAREEQVKRMRIGIGVGIAAVVLLIIFLVVRGTGGASDESEASPEALTTAQEDTAGQDSAAQTGDQADNSQYNQDFSQYELQENAYPEVNQLLGDYFQAKVDQDPEALYRVFGKTDTSDLEERRQELAYEAKFIEDYQDITCYTKPGLTEDSFVVYVTFEVKYKRTDTLAPGLLWCYVVKNTDENYIIRENVLGDEADYVAKMNQTEDVKLLSSQVNARLKTALESDTMLASYYQEMRNGAIVYESEPHDSTVTLVTEPVESESAADGSESAAAEAESAAGEAESASGGTESGSGEDSQAEESAQEAALTAYQEERAGETESSGAVSDVRIG